MCEWLANVDVHRYFWVILKTIGAVCVSTVAIVVFMVMVDRITHPEEW